MQDRIWTVSNILSMLRIALIIPVGYLLLYDFEQYNIHALILIVAASLTDLFDGMIARSMNQVTEFGKIIDPVADKLCVAFIVGILVYQGKIPVWLLLLALSRDVVIFVCGVYLKKSRNIVPSSNLAGKLAVASLAFLVVVAVLDIDRLSLVKEILIALSAAFILLSSFLYTIRFRKMLQNNILNAN
ncbi:MAG: CDP-alcohol phosphatidyltransferase family protein [Bacteroidota bacterium]